jgi:hypothetical protein
LAALAKVSPDTVSRFERGEPLKERPVDAIREALERAGVAFTNGDSPSVRLRPHASTLAAIISALESAGVEFIAENGGGPGVRLRRR